MIDVLIIRICAISSVFFGIIPLMGWVMISRLLKKNEQKRLEEVEPQLTRLSRLMTTAIVLSGITGIIAVILR